MAHQQHESGQPANGGYHALARYFDPKGDVSELWQFMSQAAKDHDTGLMPVPAQVRQGKSYNTKKLILRYLASEDSAPGENPVIGAKRRIVVITNNIHNLVHDSIAAEFRKASERGELSEADRRVWERFQQDVLVVRQTSDMLIEGLRNFETQFGEAAWSAIPPEIRNLPPPFDEDASESAAALLQKAWQQYKDADAAFLASLATRDTVQQAALEEFRQNMKTALDNAGRTFRKALRVHFKETLKRLAEEQGSKMSLLEYIDKTGQTWVRTLFPMVEMSRKKVLFMTTRRSALPLDDLHSANKSLWESELGTNCLWLIDEYHATKKVLLDTIIQNLAQQGIELVSCFRGVYHTLEKGERHGEKFYPRCVHLYRNGVATLKNLFAKCQVLFEAYNAGQNFKTDAEVEKLDRKFLYQSGLTSIFTRNGALTTKKGSKDKGETRYFVVEPDVNRGENAIRLAKDRPSGNRDLRKLIADLAYITDDFVRCVAKIANYRIAKNEADGKDFLIEEEIHSILRDFLNIGKYPNELQMLAESVYRRCFRAWSRREVEADDGENGKDGEAQAPASDSGQDTPRIPDDGAANPFSLHRATLRFKYCVLKDSRKDHYSTGLRSYKLDILPEDMLVGISHTSLVLGLSATGLVDTPLNNYDISYLRDMLGGKYLEPRAGDIAALSAEMGRLNAGIENVAIHVQAHDGESIERLGKKGARGRDGEKAMWTHLFMGDAAWSERIINEFGNRWDGAGRSLMEPCNAYIRSRYFKIASAMRSFFEHGVNAYLCFCPRHPKDDNYKLDRTFLEKAFFDFFRSRCPHAGQAAFQVFTSRDVRAQDDEAPLGDDAEFARFRQNRADGVRCFVMTAYSLSEGVNLQYPLAQDSAGDIVRLGDGSRDSGEVDWDGIFLEVPSNIVVSSMHASDAQGRSAVQKNEEFLLNAANVNYLLSRYEIGLGLCRRVLSDALHQKAAAFNGSIPDLRRTMSAKRCVASMVHQALGRIGRTSNRRKDIWIDYDMELREILDPFALDLRLESPYFTALRKDLGLQPEDASQAAKAALAADLKNSCEVINKHFRRVLRQYREYDDGIFRWKELRDFVLAHPTADSMQNAAMSRYYFANPFGREYWYHIPPENMGTFAGCQSYFANPPAGCVCVCGELLDAFMASPALKEWFASKGYATTWGSGHLQMRPVTFNNIYKGALGEAVGYHAFKSMGLELQDICDSRAFEFFDYWLPEKRVYVDFKLWRSFKTDAADVEEKAVRKVTEIAALEGVPRESIRIIFANTAPRERCEAGSVHQQEKDGVRILEVPHLYVRDGDALGLAPDMLTAIGRFIG